jgi:hypothetical protein
MPSNVINSFMAGRQVRNDQQDRDLAAQDRQSAQGMANTQGKVQNALMGGDRQGAEQMARGSGSADIMGQFQQQVGAMDDAQRTATRDGLRTLGGMAMGVLQAPPEQFQQERDRVLSTAQSLGIDVSQFPQNASPDQVRGFARMARSFDEEISRSLMSPETLGASDSRFDPVDRSQVVGQAGEQARATDMFEAETARIKANRPTSPLVAINEAGAPDPFISAFQADDAERALGVRATAQAAQETILNLDILQDTLLDPTVYTGAGAQLTLPLRRAAEQFGMDAGNVSASEVANRIANEMALSLKDQLPGPMSDGDRQFLMSIPPNLGNTREGNAALIFMTRRRAQYEQRLAASMDAALGSNPTGDAYRAWEQQQRDIARTDPLYTEDDRRAVQLLLNGAEFRRSGNDIYVIDGDEAIRLGN